MKNGKWKKFERVTEAIHRVERGGASVKWNSRVAGRRFDAVIRSKYEGREFLIVVHFVDHGAPATEAAVRKFDKDVEDAGAHMGIMVSASGYTEEAFKLSHDHSVALLGWDVINQFSEDKLADTFKPARLVYDFSFSVEGSAEEMAIPEEPA